MMAVFDFKKWILQEPKNFYSRCILYRYLVRHYVATLPPIQANLSAEEKRRLIRQHINGLKDFKQFESFKIKIDEYKIYSKTCKLLADKHGLNIRK